MSIARDTLGRVLASGPISRASQDSFCCLCKNKKRVEKSFCSDCEVRGRSLLFPTVSIISLALFFVLHLLEPDEGKRPFFIKLLYTIIAVILVIIWWVVTKPMIAKVQEGNQIQNE